MESDADDKKEFTFTIPSTYRKTATVSSSKDLQSKDLQSKDLQSKDLQSKELQCHTAREPKRRIIATTEKWHQYTNASGSLDLESVLQHKFVVSQIRKKLGGYYCKQVTRLMYENVLDPQQWTLDRIDNTMGHNRTNVIIACLTCNLRRRCAHTSKYVMTKQLQCITLLEHDT